MIPVARVLKRAWIPLVLAVVLAASGYIVDRLHGTFGSQANARSDAGIEIVQFNPKVMKYDVFGSRRDHRKHQLLGR
jgi:Mycobacterium membrane protein